MCASSGCRPGQGASAWSACRSARCRPACSRTPAAHRGWRHRDARRAMPCRKATRDRCAAGSAPRPCRRHPHRAAARWYRTARSPRPGHQQPGHPAGEAALGGARRRSGFRYQHVAVGQGQHGARMVQPFGKARDLQPLGGLRRCVLAPADGLGHPDSGIHSRSGSSFNVGLTPLTSSTESVATLPRHSHAPSASRR